MTKEQIEELRRDYGEELRHRVACELSTPEMEALLAAAERALLLEDVLRAAKLWIGDRVRIGAPHGKREAELRAAIDRAEGKP